MNILLTADEAAGNRILQLLNRSRHRISAVITEEDNQIIRKQALDQAIPIMDPARLREENISSWIQDNRIDVLLNVHLLRIIHPGIITALAFGAFNLHPGPLPHYAGLNTPGWAIYRREEQYGVTLHWMNAGIDNGPIAYRDRVQVRSNETGFSLSARCALAGTHLVSRLLNDLEKDETIVPVIPQDLTKRRYYAKGDHPQHGYIHWNRSSVEINALYRAYSYSPYESPWGFLKVMHKGSDLEIYSMKFTQDHSAAKPGTVEAVSNEGAKVATADYAVVVKMCRLNGRRIPADTVFREGDVME